MVDFMPAMSRSGSRPKRAAAKNALYQMCPTCDGKFLLTEIEFHVNLCIQKMEDEEAERLRPKMEEEEEKPRKSETFQEDPKFAAIPTAPTFRPTAEEFDDPLEYIRSIQHKARKYGICKIVPPPGVNWFAKSFEETVKEEDFFFQTKKQNIRQLARRGPSDSFYCKLQSFLEKRNGSLQPIPLIAGKRVRLYHLYITVRKFGGFRVVCNGDLWGEVASSFKLAPLPDVIKCLHGIYSTNLLAYEESDTKFELPNSPQVKRNKQYGMRANMGMGMRAVTVPTKKEQEISMKISQNGQEEESNEEEQEKEHFGFASGSVYSLRGFKRIAKRFEKNWFGTASGEKVTPGQVEAEFWKVVEEKSEPCRVQYGSDLDVKSHGSGFALEATNPWNLNILPTLPLSLLRYLPEHVSGITIPMMYVGMALSCFCWHVEDDYLYSINYVHTGAPKIWYGVSSFYSAQFEKVMRDSLPDLFTIQPDLLHQLTTMVSPLELLSHGVPVVRVVQEPGEFMVTFPQAYHGGINTGFNVAEAVNFATPDWLPFGRISIADYKKVNRSHIFSNTELIINALQLETNLESVKALFDEFWHAKEKELENRAEAQRAGITSFQAWSISGPLPHSKPCSVCNCEVYLSCVECPCSVDKRSCLLHHNELCGCAASQKILLIRYSTELLDLIVSSTEKLLGTAKKRYLSPSKNSPIWV